MTTRLNVLITAVGGDLGQGIAKALRLAEPPIRIHGSDADAAAAGRVFVDAFRPLPPASQGATYLRELDAACKDDGIDLVIPASEPEIQVLARHPSLPSGARVVCHPAPWYDTYSDKLTCMQALRGRVPLVPFADGSRRADVDALVDQAGFPLVVKPRRSSGGRGATEVHDRDQLEAALGQTPLPVVQAYIPPDSGEFSIGVFRRDNLEEAICFRRTLGPGGSSWQAETVDDPAALRYALEVARASNALGSFNVQLRFTSEGPRLLEVNARFSSLVAARAIAGFRDVEWSLALALDEPMPRVRKPFGQVRFRRFLHEIVDVGQGFAPVGAWAPRAISTGSSVSIKQVSK